MGSLSLDMSAFAKKAGANADKVVRKTAIGLFSAVMKASPVDTGRFRGAWMFTLSIPSNTSPINIRSDSEVKAEIQTGVLSYNTGQTLWFTNNLAYAETLEYGLYPKPVKYGTRRKGVSKSDPIKYEVRSINGFSYQAVGGFVRLNTMKFQTFVNQASKGL